MKSAKITALVKLKETISIWLYTIEGFLERNMQRRQVQFSYDSR